MRVERWYARGYATDWEKENHDDSHGNCTIFGCGDLILCQSMLY
jgi:hypothetical protein